jgi:hypothetical protein
MLQRNCTKDFKIMAILKQVRALAHLTKKRAPDTPVVTQWIGISIDEAIRMKPSRQRWIEHRWPLIERRLSRGDCLEWLERHDYPRPGKSACTFCPFHNDRLWSEMKRNDPESFADAVAMDEKIRNVWTSTDARKEIFLHRSCKPLVEVEFSTATDRGQLDLFLNECEGMCGV